MQTVIMTIHKVILNLFQDLSADKGQEKALGEMLN